ncbi:MAG: flavin reductase family protein [Dehalococcoidia bacterium]
MDEQAKKTTLLMLPYGLAVLGARSGEEYGAGTVNWLSQCSFNPPLVMMGVKRDSRLHDIVKAAGHFALSFLGTGQGELAFAFFKPTQHSQGKLNGIAYETAQTGAPIISDAPAWLECRLVHTFEHGDHSVMVGEVIGAGVKREEPMLTLAELGLRYGG